MHYFSIVLSQFNEKGVNFCGFGRKTQFDENFWENFKKSSEENCEKCINLADFSENLRNYALIFCAFGQNRQFIGNVEKIF